MFWTILSGKNVHTRKEDKKMKYFIYELCGNTIIKEYEVGARIFFQFLANNGYDEVGEWLPCNDGEYWEMGFYKNGIGIGVISSYTIPEMRRTKK